METNVGAGVETNVESVDGTGQGERGAVLDIHLLGPLRIVRDGEAMALPASRKVRALFAYLALAPSAITRAALCELLWDIPNDPRGELRWALSKIRSFVDADRGSRVVTREAGIRLDLSDCSVDAVEVARGTRDGIDKLDLAQQRHLVTRFAGEFLEGLEIDRQPAFSAWLTAQRRQFNATRAALLDAIAGALPDDEAFGYLEQWLAVAPFDQRAHERFLAALARRGRIREGDAHLASAVRLFESDGLDCAPLRHAWRSAKAQATGAPRLALVPAPVAVARLADDEFSRHSPRRASIAVMPFVDRSDAVSIRGGPGDALAYDVITRLAKLRSLFVIAQGTTFALQERRVDPEDAGRLLGVDYVVSGSVRAGGNRLGVTVELAETQTRRVVWAETFSRCADDVFGVLEEIGDRIVAAVAGEIETIERNRAILRPPSSLDAWEAHHRGLWHMYRFNKGDNERASQFFRQAVDLDPTFSRAHAGLSFTHFQNVFQGWVDRREPEVDRAFETAGQSLMADDRDPAAHLSMGRALWLRGSHDASIVELERAIELSPNFAHGHYALAFVHAQDGDPEAAISASDYSRALSPCDPMLFAMLGARAMALVRLRRFDEAAQWAVKAAARPNAHPHILAIAAFALSLAGARDEASRHAAAIRKLSPQYGSADFLGAFRYDAQGAALFAKGAQAVGMA